MNKPRRSPYVSFLHSASHSEGVVPPSTTLAATLEALPESTHWAINRINQVDGGVTIANAIRNNQAVAVSDGSLKLAVGTAAFVLEGANHVNRLTGVNEVPGPLKDGDSHRCELARIYGIVMVVQGIITLHTVTSGSILLACDNEQSLQIFEPDYIPDPNDKNFDLVNAIWTTTPVHAYLLEPRTCQGPPRQAHSGPYAPPPGPAQY